MLIEFMCTERGKIYLPPPVPASKCIPDWYRRMPRGRDDFDLTPRKTTSWIDPKVGIKIRPTIKECVPIQDYLTCGYIVPLWSDLAIKQLEDGGNFFGWGNDDAMEMTSHEPCQVLGSPVGDGSDFGRVWKLMSPWHFKTPPGYSCFFFSPRYSNCQIEIFPAVVDTDKCHEVNFPFTFHRRGDQDEYIIPRGEGIIQVFPFKRTDWESKITTITELQISGFRTLIRSFISGGYRSIFHSKKKYM